MALPGCIRREPGDEDSDGEGLEAAPASKETSAPWIPLKRAALQPGESPDWPPSPVKSPGSCSFSPRRLWTNFHGSPSEANEELPASTRTYFSSPGSLREASPRCLPPKRVVATPLPRDGPGPRAVRGTDRLKRPRGVQSVHLLSIEVEEEEATVRVAPGLSSAPEGSGAAGGSGVPDTQRRNFRHSKSETWLAREAVQKAVSQKVREVSGSTASKVTRPCEESSAKGCAGARRRPGEGSNGPLAGSSRGRGRGLKGPGGQSQARPGSFGDGAGFKAGNGGTGRGPGYGSGGHGPGCGRNGQGSGLGYGPGGPRGGIGYGLGYPGPGAGFGPGYGPGSGPGYGPGYCFGDGLGNGPCYGTGDRRGSGPGHGAGYGHGLGYPGDGPGDRPGSGPGYGPGNGPGDGPGSGLGNGPGYGPGDGPGNGPGYGPGNGPGDGPGSGLGNGPGYGPGDGPGNGPGYGPGHGAGDGPGSGPGNGPGGPGSGPGDGPGNGPGYGPGNGPGDGPGSGPGYGPGNGPGYGPGDGPGSGPGNGPGYGPGNGPGYGPGNGPGDGPGSGPGNGPGYGPGDGPGSGPGYGPGNGPGRGSGSKAGSRHGSKAGDSSSGNRVAPGDEADEDDSAGPIPPAKSFSSPKRTGKRAQQSAQLTSAKRISPSPGPTRSPRGLSRTRSPRSPRSPRSRERPVRAKSLSPKATPRSADTDETQDVEKATISGVKAAPEAEEAAKAGEEGKGKGKGKVAPPPPPPKEAEEGAKGKGKGKKPPPALPAAKQKGEGKKGKPGKGKGSEEEEARMLMRKPEVIPGVQVKRLFWNPIHLRANHSSYTVWDAIDGEGYPIDLEELEWLFAESKSPRGQKTEPEKGEVGKRVIRVLDEQRRRQICIMLARLPGTMGDVLRWVNEMDASKLGKDEVDLLLQNNPSVEEMQLLRRAQEEHVIDENTVWDTAEDFMLSLIAIPRFQLRLKIWDFVNSFQEKFEHLAGDVKGISWGCHCLLTSMRMRHLLGLALHAGNFLNGGTTRGRADGFAMETLLQLRTVKATQASDQTLVHFIATQMEKRYPGELAGIFGDGEEAHWIRHAARRRIEDAAQECTSLLGQALHMVKTIRFVLDDDADFESDSCSKAKLWHATERLAMCIAELEALQSRQGQLSGQYESLCLWLHIDVDKPKPSDELFGIWHTFLQDVQAARRAIREKEQAARKKRPVSRPRRVRSTTVPAMSAYAEADVEPEEKEKQSHGTRSVPLLRLARIGGTDPADAVENEEASAASSTEHAHAQDSDSTSSELQLTPRGPEVEKAADMLEKALEKVTPNAEVTKSMDEVLEEYKRRGSAYRCMTGERSRIDGVVELTFAIPAREAAAEGSAAEGSDGESEVTQRRESLWSGAEVW